MQQQPDARRVGVLARLRRHGFTVETFRPDRGTHDFTPELRERVVTFRDARGR